MVERSPIWALREEFAGFEAAPMLDVDLMVWRGMVEELLRPPRVKTASG